MKQLTTQNMIGFALGLLFLFAVVYVIGLGFQKGKEAA